ncbi:hypothetical protein ACOMHN_004182 [Nucella lapillus]
MRGLPRRDRVHTLVLYGVRRDAGPRVKRNSNLASSIANSGCEALGSPEARWPPEGWSVVLQIWRFLPTGARIARNSENCRRTLV